MLLPVIDFANHPAYRGLAETFSATSRDEVRARRAFELENARTVWESFRSVWNYPDDRALGNAPRRLDDLRRDGIVGVTLGPLLGTLRSVAEPYLDRIRQIRAAARPRTPRDAQIRLTLADLREPENQSLRHVVQELLESTELVELVGRYLNAREIAVPYAQFKISDRRQPEYAGTRNAFADIGVPDPPWGYMHIDTTPFHLKAIIYLTDVVGPAHGPFRYVLGSNRAPHIPFDDYLERVATQHFVAARDLEGRRKLMALPAIERQRLDFGTDLAAGSETGRGLLEREATFTSGQADMMLFDPRGIHRGAHVTAGERAILQLSLEGQRPAPA